MKSDTGFPQAPRTVVKTKPADQAVTSSTTLVNDADLWMVLAPNETWVIDFVIDASFNTLGQSKVAFTVPSGCAIKALTELKSNGVASVVPIAITVGGVSVALVGTLATTGQIKISACVINGSNAGNLQLQFAQNASNGGPTTFLAGSSMTAIKQ